MEIESIYMIKSLLFYDGRIGVHRTLHKLINSQSESAVQ